MVVDWKVLVEQQGQLFSNVVKTNNKLMSEMSELRDQVDMCYLQYMPSLSDILHLFYLLVKDRASPKWSERLEDTN